MNNLLPLLSSLQISIVELGLIGLVLLILCLDLWKYKFKFDLIVIVALLGVAAILGHMLTHTSELIGLGFSNFYQTTRIDILFKAIFLLGAFITILMVASKRYVAGEVSGEPFLLILLGTLGACFTASSNELITLFISIEILTFASYILTSYSTASRPSAEAGMKYLILGGLSSAFFLFGTALLYGLFGSTEFSVISTALTSEVPPATWLAFLFLFVGVGFKMGVFPFHIWIPDVYEGAPTWVSGFLSTVSKAAGFIAFGKLLSIFSIPLGGLLYTVLGILTIVTVLYGNLGAFMQENLKRLLGYSSIAQAGYLMLALINPEPFGFKAVAFYLVIYTLSNLLVFLSVYLAESKKKSRKGLLGLSSRSYLLSLSFFVGLASLAGVPPMAGFIGKFFLFLSAFKAGAYLALSFALVGVLISMFYYFRIIKLVFTPPPEDEPKPLPIDLTPTARITLVSLAFLIIALGIYPAPLLNLIF
jgi:NADH-quinone oxidoreductase subunit N